MALELLKNANIAAGRVLPGCQDTGTAIVMGHKGENVFTGVDDAYEVYLDGVAKGTGGDIGERRTAFDEEKSHLLTDAATAGPVTIDVRVYDWYGAGGIHRPVRLSTRPLGVASRFLRGPADG